MFERVDADAVSEIRSMVNVRPLLGDLPIPFGRWAATGHLAETVARLLMLHRPKLTVECGSGSSTVLIASCLKHIGEEGQVLSLDHEPKFAEKTRRMIEVAEVEEYTDVRTAPLVEQELYENTVIWYDLEPSVLSGRKVDLMVVDGPPADTGPLARYPAVPFFEDHLSENCIIVLDDGDRPDENEIAHRWAEELGARLEYAGGLKGSWVIYCGENQ